MIGWYARREEEIQCDARSRRSGRCKKPGDTHAVIDGEEFYLCRLHLHHARKKHEVEELGPAPGYRRYCHKQDRLMRIAIRAEVLREEGRIP